MVRIGTDHARVSYCVVPRSSRGFHTIWPKRNHDTIQGKLRIRSEYESQEWNLDTIQESTMRSEDSVSTVRPDEQYYTLWYDTNRERYNTYGKPHAVMHMTVYDAIRYNTYHENAVATWEISFTIREIFFYAPRLSYCISSGHNWIVLKDCMPFSLKKQYFSFPERNVYFQFSRHPPYELHTPFWIKCLSPTPSAADYLIPIPFCR
jgi:hypothetical protein